MINTLEIDSVLKSFGQKRLLTDIYLKCQSGDIIGLLGRNGTGKSTLLKIIFGVLPADGKFIRLNGRRDDQLYKTVGQIGYLPQHGFLLKELSVEKTISMFITKENIESFLEDDIINKLIKNKTGNLSGGEARYLEIKLLLNSENKFILLDEPFNGIAPIIVNLVKDMIINHSKTKGIVLTDHDYDNVLGVATKKYLLHDGGLKQITTAEDLKRWGYLPK